MKRKILFGLVIISCFSGCTTAVTQKGFDSFGSDIYQNFVYYVSQDVTLRETVVMGVGDHVTQDDSGKVILINREIVITRKSRGRVQNATSTKFEVAFEELPGEIKPVITFNLNPADEKKRYFIDTSTWREVNLVDQRGEYGYISVSGNVISYNDKRHLIVYAGKEAPYLIQELNIGIRNETRKATGLR